MIIAIAKGRVLQQTLPILEKINLIVANNELKSRKLILTTNDKSIKIIIARSIDVPVFVKHGAADIGIVGKDILLEQNTDNIFEMLDLNIAKCKLMLAAKKNANINKNIIKVATKYNNCAKKYFIENNQRCEIIKLYGAMELAPIIGLSDVIVDLVDTGNTLAANNLVAIKKIYDISSRLIVNRASYIINNKKIKNLITKITAVI